MKRALVIGGTGFLGLNLVDALLAEGIETRVSWRRKSVTVFVSKRDVELVAGDLTDPESLETAMQGCDTVYLAGAHYPRYSLDRDAAIARGVRDVANACTAARRAGVSRLVYTSSIASLGTAESGAIDESDVPATMPTESVYRAVKWSMEREVERQQAVGLDIVTLLPGGCLGPWDVRVGTSGLMVAFITGALPWWVDGIVNLVDVRDVATAHVRAGARAAPGSRYCVGGHSLALRTVFEKIGARYGGEFPIELSVRTARERATEEERAASETRRRAPFPRELVDIIAWSQRVSSARIATELGVRPRPLEQTLDDTERWFRRFGYLRVRPQMRNAQP